MKKITFLLLLSLTKISIAQTGLHFQWHRQSMQFYNMFATHKDTLFDFCRVGYNVSNVNTLAKLNPNTNSWTYYNSPISPTLNPAVFMRDAYNGAIYTATNNVYITNDGWLTSTLHTTISTLPYNATKQGYLSFTSTFPYNLQFSADISNWTSVATVTNYPYFVKGNSKLFVLDGDKLLTSVNGGASYSTQTSTTSLGTGRLFAANDDTLFIAGTNNFRQSFDGGATWLTATLPSTTYIVSELACKNGKELLLFMQPSNLSQKYFYYSNNSGATWTVLTGMPFFGTGKIMATSKYFMIYPSYYSTNGTTWEQLFPKVKSDAFEINFTGNKGLAGFDGGYVAYSNNKGATFEIFQTAISGEDIMAVKVLPNGNCLAGDRKGCVFESTNNGQSWIQRYNNTVSNLVATKFSYSQNSNTIVCTRQGQPLMSVDGGTNYVIVNVGGGQHSQTMKPVAGEMIDVGGLYPSPNFTLTSWEFNKVTAAGVKTLLSTLTTTSTPNESILDVHNATDNVGYFVAKNNTTGETMIYKTTNGWQTVANIASLPAGSGYAICKIQCFGVDTVMLSGPGAASGNTNTFYHISTNGGASWTKINTNFSIPSANLGNRVYKMHFFNANEYMALISDGFAGPTGSSDGAYLSVNGTGGSTVPNGINEFVKANNQSRVHIYPNPTAFNFNLQSENYFNKVEVYTVSGQLVKTVEAGLLKELEIETNDMSSGIYFVKIYSGNKPAGQTKLVVCK